MQTPDDIFNFIPQVNDFIIEVFKFVIWATRPLDRPYSYSFRLFISITGLRGVVIVID